MDDDHAVAAAPNRKPATSTSSTCGGGGEAGKAMMVMVSATLVYYHCAYRNSTFLSLVSDVFIVILSSLAILGLLFRHFNIQVPVDPLEWQISQEAANGTVACLANTVGAAESVLRVAATGHDKRLFLKVVFSLYMLSVLGRMVSGLTVAYAVACLLFLYYIAASLRILEEISSLCLFCLYMLAESSEFFSRRRALSSPRSDGTDEM